MSVLEKFKIIAQHSLKLKRGRQLTRDLQWKVKVKLWLLSEIRPWMGNWPAMLYFLDIYEFYYLNRYNYNLAHLPQHGKNAQTQIPYYIYENYTPFLYFLPSFCPPVDCYSQPIYNPFYPPQLATEEEQPKTARRTSSEVPPCKRKERQMDQFCSKQEQNSDKREENKSVKRSLVDSIELQNRNILPNMTNVILSYVRRVNKSGKEVRKVLQALKRQDIQYAMKKFYAYQNFLKNNVNDFIIRNGIKALMDRLDPDCTCFSLSEQAEYNKVFRIVVLRYLEKQYLEFILTSKKMDEPKRKDHIKVRRYLIETLYRVPNQDPHTLL